MSSSDRGLHATPARAQPMTNMVEPRRRTAPVGLELSAVTDRNLLVGKHTPTGRKGPAGGSMLPLRSST